jgi:hypothetical protein
MSLDTYQAIAQNEMLRLDTGYGPRIRGREEPVCQYNLSGLDHLPEACIVGIDVREGPGLLYDAGRGRSVPVYH